MSSSAHGAGGRGDERARKRHRRSRTTGDSVADYHKGVASREAERNAEAKRQAQEISQLLKDPKALKQEIERLKQEEGVDNSKMIKSLEANLERLMQDAQGRLRKQEQDSELAVKRRLAAGLAAGPAPPNHDPPRRGPGFPPPKPPPFRELPPPPPPKSYPKAPPMMVPPPKLIEHIPKVEPDKQEEEVPAKSAPKLFMPTSVAVQLKKSGQ